MPLWMRSGNGSLKQVTLLEPGKIDPVKLRQLIDQLETIAGIQQGFEESLR